MVDLLFNSEYNWYHRSLVCHLMVFLRQNVSNSEQSYNEHFNYSKFMEP